jgi:hypothetical protein
MATKLRILGKDIKVEFKQGKGAAKAPDEAALMPAVQKMADLINGRQWPDDLADSYRGLKKIVFFNGQVKVNGFLVSRPGIDEKKAIFYWEVKEFEADDADGHANTLFHDSWHVVQYKRAGNKFAVKIDERVAREVDATDQQIRAATILGSSASDIAHLKDFRAHPETIKQRLEEGIG